MTKEIENEVRFDTQKKLMEQAIDNRVSVSGNKKDEELREIFYAYLRTGDATELRQLNNYSAAEGGATVPTSLYNAITAKLAQDVTVRRLPGVQVMNTVSNLDFPLEATAPTADWVAAAPSASYGEGDPVFGTVTARAHKLGRIVKVGEELLEDNAVTIWPLGQLELLPVVAVAVGAHLLQG